MNIKDLVGQKVSFSIYGAIGGESEFSGKAVGSMEGSFIPDPGTALVNHSNIWPAIPKDITDPLADSFSSYEYLIMVSDSGEVSYIGSPWINYDSVLAENLRTASVEVINFTDQDASRLRKVLESNSFTVGTIKIA